MVVVVRGGRREREVWVCGKRVVGWERGGGVEGSGLAVRDSERSTQALATSNAWWCRQNDAAMGSVSTAGGGTWPWESVDAAMHLDISRYTARERHRASVH